MKRQTFARVLVVVSLAAGGAATASGPARADFHLMVVQEVSAGTMAEPNADFVELRMTAPGQGNVSGHQLLLYDAAGSRMDCTLPTDVVDQAFGDPILFGTAEYQATPSPNPNFTIPPLLHADGGAACWESIDCVSWGSFSGSTTSPAGTPKLGGIPPDKSIDRIGGDTNDSNTDFVVADPPSPAPNAGALGGATTCAPEPTGGGGQFAVRDLKAKVRGNRVTITGEIAPPAPGQTVALTLFANGSPLRKVAKKTATLNADSEFRKRFKVPSDSTRCKVKVAFHGATVGSKKFKC